MKSWAEETRERLAHIPVLPLDDLRALPEPEPFEGGVYFLWLSDNLVYVGRSRHVMDRLPIIRRNTRYAPVGFFPAPMPFDRCTVLVFDFPTVEQFHYATKDYEHAYIAAYLPEYNSDYKTAGNWS